MRLSYMTCCCCGAECPPMQQWHNRDNGFSICTRCVESERRHGSSEEEEIKSYYGIAGVHYASTENM